MKEPPARHRPPLIPTISTLDQEKPVEPDASAPEKPQKVCVVVITIEVGSEPLKPA